MSATRDIKDPLTPRQLEFLVEVANGLSYEEIAEKMNVSPGHVQNTMDQARDRAGVRNITQLAALCVSAGFIVYQDD